MIKLTNISGGLIVCDLAKEGKTLRFGNAQSETIKDDEITPYIENLVLSGLVLKETITEKKKTVPKNSKKEKEE